MMFDFATNNPRKRLFEAKDKLARVVHSAATSFLEVAGDQREHIRIGFSLPVMIAAWEQGAPKDDACVIGLTKDVSDHGISVLLSQPLEASEVVAAFWSDNSQPEPSFFLGEICHNSSVGGGFYRIGLEFNEFANTRHSEGIACLKPMAAQLLPCPV